MPKKTKEERVEMEKAFDKFHKEMDRLERKRFKLTVAMDIILVLFFLSIQVLTLITPEENHVRIYGNAIFLMLFIIALNRHRR